MIKETLKPSLLVWLGLFAIAFANGALREIFFKRVLAHPWPHFISTLMAVVLFALFVESFWPRLNVDSMRRAIAVGGLWFVLTISTETFVLNRWLSGLNWRQIAQSYDVTDGHLWPFVLIWIGALPAVMFWMRGPSALFRTRRAS